MPLIMQYKFQINGKKKSTIQWLMSFSHETAIINSYTVQEKERRGVKIKS